MTRWAELVAAFMLLTRLPVARLMPRDSRPRGGETGPVNRANPPPGACLWAYPVVGAAIGGLGAAVFLLASRHATPAVAALLAVAATALATGALHEDGLADTADSFGGATRARRLEVMRDSRIGSYGTLVLLLATGLRVAGIAGSAHPALALLLAGVLARGAILVPLVLLGPARPDGLAASLGGGWPARTGLALAALAGLAAPVALLAAAVAAWLAALATRRHLGGYTGDTLGATEQLAECAVLLSL